MNTWLLGSEFTWDTTLKIIFAQLLGLQENQARAFGAFDLCSLGPALSPDPRAYGLEPRPVQH